MTDYHYTIRGLDANNKAWHVGGTIRDYDYHEAMDIVREAVVLDWIGLDGRDGLVAPFRVVRILVYTMEGYIDDDLLRLHPGVK